MKSFTLFRYDNEHDNENTSPQKCNKVLASKIQELIIKATKLNLRDVKRFINPIVMSHEIYGQKINNIEK